MAQSVFPFPVQSPLLMLKMFNFHIFNSDMKMRPETCPNLAAIIILTLLQLILLLLFNFNVAPLRKSVETPRPRPFQNRQLWQLKLNTKYIPKLLKFAG